MANLFELKTKQQNNSEIRHVQDIKSGFIISLIALPLCLGIATASGFPPFAGLITAIIGGLIGTWLGSASFTIKGPAAGLIVIVLGAVMELGQGDLIKGYHQALAVGVGAGILQFIFAMLRTAKIGIAMSKTVVHGMLAAIGVIIIAKQLHVLLGVTPHAHEAFGLIKELPHSLLTENFAISIIGLLSIIVLLSWQHIAVGIFKKIPAQLVVLALAIPLAVMMGLNHDSPKQFLGLTVHSDPKFIVHLPDSILSGLAFPDFSAFFTLTSIKYILMFALVGSIESTLSAVAVDAINQYKYPSDLNKDLRAVAIGNIISASLGGLPMISEIVRSKANIDAGAQSRMSNFWHGAFLLVYLLFLSSIIELIPLSALAAMLIMTGLRLASFKEITHANSLGKDQLVLFVITILTTLATDLLIGVIAGLTVKIIMHTFRGVTPIDLFKSKAKAVKHNHQWYIKIENNAAFNCLLKVKKSLRDITDNNVNVIIDVSNAKIVDHTFLSGLDVVFSDRPDLTKEIQGLNKFSAFNNNPLSVHVQRV